MYLPLMISRAQLKPLNFKRREARGTYHMKGKYEKCAESSSAWMCTVQATKLSLYGRGNLLPHTLQWQEKNRACHTRMYRVEQKNLAKLSDTCYVRADRLCIGSPRLVRGGKARNSNM